MRTIRRLAVGFAAAGLLTVGLAGAASADTASAGNGGTATAGADGGGVTVGTVDSGSNLGAQITAAVAAAIGGEAGTGDAATTAEGGETAG